MGLFGSRTRTKVFTQAQRVIKDELLPNSIKTGVTKSIFQNGNISEYVVEELLQSLGVRCERMYEFGKRNYVHGLPSGSFHNASEGRRELQTVLDALEGQPVSIQYSHYGPRNLLHLGWMHLQYNWGYDPETNTFPGAEAAYGSPLYLLDLQPVVANVQDYDPESLEMWGTPASAGYTPNRPFILDPRFAGMLTGHSPLIEDAALSEGVWVKVMWQTKEMVREHDYEYEVTVDHTDETFIPVGVPDPDADYFHAKYIVNGKTKYWAYQIGLGSYPVLDTIHTTQPEVGGQYFPFTYFRYDKTSERANTSTTEYKHAKKMAGYLNMNFKQVSKAIDENPDIKDVEQAMVMLAVPAMSEDPEELNYLWEYFDRWFYNSDEQFQTSDFFNINDFLNGDQELDIVKSSVIIEDKRFKMALSHGGIFKTTKAMTIGKKGTVTVEQGTETIEVPYVYGGMGIPEIRTATFNFKTHIYRKQISDYVCEQIEVVNLKMKYHIWKEYSVTADDDNQDILLIPLDRSLLQHMSIPKKEVIYARALHYIFNSRVTTKLRWYQTGIFQAIMFIIAVVITIFTWGGGTPLVAAAAAGTTALMAHIVLSLIITIAVQVVMKMVIKALGVEAAAVLAIVAMAFGFYAELSGSNPFSSLPWGDQLLMVSNNLASGFSDALGDVIQNLYKDMYEFKLFADKELEELERLTNDALSETKIWNPMILFGETPDQYYNRTVHAGNVGTYCYDSVSSFVERSLALPEISETLYYGEE